jgi:hypothetical protein
MRPAHRLDSHESRRGTSWPAALLPGALLLALLGSAAGATPSGNDVPQTELHVVEAPR